MKTVLLAAGRSKRLKPLGDKNFLSFLGKPLVLHQMEELSKAGFNDFIIVAGSHNIGAIEDLIGEKDYKAIVVEQKNLDDGMAGAMHSVEKFFKNEPILIVSCNDIVKCGAFHQIMAAHRIAEHGLLLAKEVHSYFPGGYLKVDNDYFCDEIIEKPGEGNEPSNLVNIVVHYFGQSDQLFDAIKDADSKKDDRYEVALANMMKKGLRIRAIPYEGFWKPVKYPWHVLDLMDHFLSSLKNYEIKNLEDSNIVIADTATIKGGVFLENGVKIMDNAVISGPAYIGKNTIVATNALVRNSHIGSDCVVGFGTEIARSYLGNGVWTHTNYVGDSVIGNNCSFGSGTVTGNLRLDEGEIEVNIKGEKTLSGRNKLGLITGDNVRCGINTSFMPGVKIGSNSMVGAGIVVAEDVDNGKFVYAKSELVVKDNKVTLDGEKRKEMQNKLKNT